MIILYYVIIRVSMESGKIYNAFIINITFYGINYKKKIP